MLRNSSFTHCRYRSAGDEVKRWNSSSESPTARLITRAYDDPAYHRTFNEEHMGGRILLAIRKVLGDPIHVLRRRHKEIHRFKPGLGIAVVRDKLNICRP